MTKYCVISWSGGMDSTSLVLRKLREDFFVYAISFNYGQRHSVELERVQDNLRYFRQHNINIHHKVIDLRSAFKSISSALTDKDVVMPEGYYEEENMKATVVPNRNAIFSSIIYAQALALSDEMNSRVEISLGVHSGDHAIYPDCRPEFYQKIMDAFSIGNWNTDKISLSLPYLHDNKTIILQDGQISCDELNLEFNTVYRNTITSYDPDEFGRSSGKTGADNERILAFDELGLVDPVQYQDPWEVVLENARFSRREFLKAR